MSNTRSGFTTFLSELRRRRVFRVAVVYAGVAFIIIQIIDGAFDYLPIPDWVGTVIIVLLLLGFPVAVGLAWAFDITEKGVVRTAAKESAEAKAPRRVLIGNKTLAAIAAVAVAVAVWSYLSKGEQPGPITSIAVLPLENLMNDPDQDYFVDGMHEALISELGKISALRVISRTSVMQYKTAPKSLPEIARELHVDAVVEGSVLRAGDRVKITAQLVGTQPERHLWTDNYTRDLRDILALHSEVARDIAGEIRAAITPAEDLSLRRKRPVDPDAFDAYIRGRHFWNKRTAKHLYKAIEYFQQAIELDPGCALGYHGLADVYIVLQEYDAAVPAEEYFTQAKAAALKALELNPDLGEAYPALASVMDLRGEPWAEVEKYYQRAIELSPSYATAHHWYGLGFRDRGRLEEFKKEIWRAYELDPLSLVIRSNIADFYYFSRQYDQMISEAQKMLELDSTFFWTKIELGKGYLMKGESTKALRYLKEGVELSDSSLVSLLHLGCAYAITGEQDQALEIMSSVKDWSLLSRDARNLLLQLYTCVGAIDDVFTILEELYVDEPHPDLLQYYTIDPLFDPVTQDPRFSALLEKAEARAREK
ncbi:MAG: hypothetical protein GH143_08750 [Calditrichaeota bacterium]|nr:hypothetical protein [Calditrichota bacterium]